MRHENAFPLEPAHGIPPCLDSSWMRPTVGYVITSQCLKSLGLGPPSCHHPAVCCRGTGVAPGRLLGLCSAYGLQQPRHLPSTLLLVPHPGCIDLALDLVALTGERPVRNSLRCLWVARDVGCSSQGPETQFLLDGGSRRNQNEGVYHFGWSSVGAAVTHSAGP